MGKTLFERVWDAHVVREEPDQPALLYVDLHLIHEVTSPQAFEGLRLAGRRVRRPDRSLATMDHNVPTVDGPITDPLARAQLDALRRNCEEFGVPLYATGSGREGIVHVIGPELGVTQPGMTIVCGDSHTSTHGAFGALAFGIGTSEVEHVLATQTLPQRRPRTMRIRFDGELPLGVTAKDVILGAIGQIGVAGGAGHVIEYAGPAVRGLSMEGRMTICNMSIEAGARAGMIAPDDTTFAYLEGRPGAPAGAEWERRLDEWRRLPSDPDAVFDREVEIDVRELAPAGDLGHEPGHGRAGRRAASPTRPRSTDPDDRAAAERALAYMALEPGTPIARDPRSTASSSARARTPGSRTSAWPPDRRRAPRPSLGQGDGRARARPRSAARRRRRASTPSSSGAGFEWRRAGCSMCLGMNPDVLAPGERCASTSNRNFEGRQGRGGRTHLVSPAMAAAAALAGRFVDVRELASEAVAA